LYCQDDRSRDGGTGRHARLEAKDKYFGIWVVILEMIW